MSLPNYLQKTKNGWFRYRRPVPADLRGFIKKKVYIVCLHTRDLETAKAASQHVSVDFNAMIGKARSSLSRRSQQLLRTADIDTLSNRFEALLLFSDEDERSQKLGKGELEAHKALIREGAQQTKDAFYAQDVSTYVEDYLSFAETEGLRINPKWSHFERFALGMATVKKCIRLLSSAIQRAVDDKRLKVNPLAALKFPSAKDSIERLTFSVEQLNQIFQSPVYMQSYRPVGGAGEACFWLPLFGLLGDGRETEHGQPLLTDIGCENGIYYIEVTEESLSFGNPHASNTVKTKSALSCAAAIRIARAELSFVSSSAVRMAT